MAAGGGQRPRLRLSRRRPAPAAGPPRLQPYPSLNPALWLSPRPNSALSPTPCVAHPAPTALPSVSRPPSGRPWFLQEVEGGNSEPWAELLRALRPDVDPASAPPLPAFPRQEPQRDLGQAAPSEVYTVGGKAFTWTPFPPALGRFTHRPPRKATGRLGSPTRSPFQCPESESEPSRTVSTKKRPLVAEKPSVEKKPALTCCPMCLVEFSATLSQLDIDAHLAQCLAESTDDIMW
ncbi:Fanconi anemia core complex-associated protein 20 [Rhynchocyon petersi]